MRVLWVDYQANSPLRLGGHRACCWSPAPIARAARGAAGRPRPSMRPRRKHSAGAGVVTERR